MSIAEKLTQIAENEQRVYDAGKKARTRDFWERITGYGQRTVYDSAFRNTDLTGEVFPEDLFNIGTSRTLFYYYYGTSLPGGVDLSNVNTTNVNDSSSAFNTFGYCSKLEEIYDVKMPAQTHYYFTFQNCPRLRKIEKVRSHKDTAFTSVFATSPNIEEIGFEGVIGKNISVSACTKLTKATLLNLIDCLYNYSGTTTKPTCTLGTTNLAKLTDAEKAVATGKGWTLA